MLRWFIAFFSIFFIVIIWFFAYYWFFNNTNIYIAERWWEYIVYEEYIWDYAKSSEVIDKIYYELLDNEKIETYRWVWIFYDNPKKVKKENLRSDLWNILEKKDEWRVEELEKKYNIKQIPRKEYIISEFPIRWGFSYFIWIMKIYPKLNKFSEKNWYLEDTTVIEIYDIPNSKIIYRKEAIKKD